MVSSENTHRWGNYHCTDGFQFFLKKMDNPRPLFCLFSSFQTNNTILTTVKNVYPVYGAGIQTHDLCKIILLP